MPGSIGNGRHFVVGLDRPLDPEWIFPGLQFNPAFPEPVCIAYGKPDRHPDVLRVPLPEQFDHGVHQARIRVAVLPGAIRVVRERYHFIGP